MRRTIFDHTPDGLRRRLADMERQIADLQKVRNPPAPPTPAVVLTLPFNWSGPVADLLDMRNGPGWFPTEGTIYRIAYRFDVAAAVTVEWELAGSVFTTHTPSADTTVSLAQTYAGQDIVATVTSDAGAEGLTAFVFLR